MKGVRALYDDPETAQRAVTALARAGLSAGDLVVVSSEPLEQYAFGRDESHTWMPWLAAFGGLVGGSLAFFLTATAQTQWPLQTGGMPTITTGTNAIIVYELTMLGAIVATIVTFLAGVRLPARLRQPYDRAISDGKILICVLNTQRCSSEDIARHLRDSGGDQVGEVEV